MQAEFVRSSVGKKVLMAVTGLLLLGFVIGHAIGNLFIFLGPDALNSYAEKLRHLGALLWVVRTVLLAAVLLHIWASIVVTLENKNARPIEYELKKTIRTTWPKKTMMLSGLFLAGFIVFHLLHFTFRVTHPDISHLEDVLGRPDVYSMVVLSFQNVYLSLFYVAAMAFLCLHLAHGASSWLQTLGWNNERTLPFFEWAGTWIAAALFVGYASVPLSICLGLITLTRGAVS